MVVYFFDYRCKKCRMFHVRLSVYFNYYFHLFNFAILFSALNQGKILYFFIMKQVDSRNIKKEFLIGQRTICLTALCEWASPTLDFGSNQSLHRYILKTRHRGNLRHFTLLGFERSNIELRTLFESSLIMEVMELVSSWP